MGQGNATDYVICQSEELQDGERRVVQCGPIAVGVFRVKGQLRAWENLCAHQGGPVCQGKIIPRVEEVLTDDQRARGYRFSDSNIHIVCPWHGYEYDLVTGEHPGDRHVSLNPVQVMEQNGTIVVRIARG
jgi:nitrite reductase/ring-hydroxylating ferredoxin subunit